jgi:hypothetical protein
MAALGLAAPRRLPGIGIAVHSAEVGSLTNRVKTSLSDHCPVVAELSDEAQQIDGSWILPSPVYLSSESFFAAAYVMVPIVIKPAM